MSYAWLITVDKICPDEDGDDMGVCEEGFEPLDDFGTPAAGCTSIKYKNPKTGAWEIL